MQLPKRFGLAFHVSATPTGKSKSVCLFVPAHYRRWEDGDTRSIPVDDVGFISCVRCQKFLGSMINWDLSNDRELQCRSGSFMGKVRRFARFLKNKSLSDALRKQVTRVCVDSSMMYGLESLALSETDFKFLQQKRGHLLLKLCNINRYAMRYMHVSYAKIRQRFKLASVREKVMRRQLGFVAKLVRLENRTAPERMLLGGILMLADEYRGHQYSRPDSLTIGPNRARRDIAGHLHPTDARSFRTTFDGAVSHTLEYRATQLWKYAVLDGRELKPAFESKPYIARMIHFDGPVRADGHLEDKDDNKYFWAELIRNDPDRWQRVVRYAVFEQPDGTEAEQRTHRQNHFANAISSNFTHSHGGATAIRRTMQRL